MLNPNLVPLSSPEGQKMLDESNSSGITSHWAKILPIFGKQTGRAFCGVQSCCIVFNSLGLINDGPFLEKDFWTYPFSRKVDQNLVAKSGMTLDQLVEILQAKGDVLVKAVKTNESSVGEFREVVKEVMALSLIHISDPRD